MKRLSIVSFFSMFVFCASSLATPPDKLQLCEKDRTANFLEKTLSPVLAKNDYKKASSLLEIELKACMPEKRLDREALLVFLAMSYLEVGDKENCKRVAEYTSSPEQIMTDKSIPKEEWEGVGELLSMSQVVRQACLSQ